jgi:hypothetical protein
MAMIVAASGQNANTIYEPAIVAAQWPEGKYLLT